MSKRSEAVAVQRAASLPWAGIVWAAALVAGADLVYAFARGKRLPLHQISPVAFGAGVLLATLVVLVVHLGAGWFIARRWAPERRRRALIGLAAVFGFGWHLTLVEGDGLRASAWYWPVRLALAVVLPGLLAAFATFVLWPGRLRPSLRTACLLAAVGGGLAFNLFVLPAYRDFHGYLAVFVATCAAFLLTPVARCVWGQTLALVLLIGVGITVPLASPARRVLEGNVRRLTRTAGPMLAAMPLTEPLLLAIEPLVDPETPVVAGEAQSYEQMHAAKVREARALSVTPSGRNVVLLVLESTRADVWANPDVAPAFHRIRSHGLYVPAAIAQYPATPLAYGAMFTAQPPSVVTQAPYWGRHRLFDRIAGRFDRRIYTRPDVKWFDHTAITDFFVPRGDPVHEHADTVDALDHLRARIEGAAPGESFFAWAHLYDPHDPWESRDGFDFGDDIRGRYTSEVAWLDQQLGGFLEWFFARPESAETLLLIIGDHGEGLGETVYGEPFVGHHVHVNGLVSRVPFFAAGPGLPRGVKLDLPVMQMDVMPSIYDFIGAVPPDDWLWQGRSIYGLLADPGPRPLPTEAFSIRGGEFFDMVSEASTAEDPEALREAFRRMNEEGTYAPKLGLQVGRWKIVRDAMLDRDWLYDVVDDPFETRDLAVEQPDALSRMRGALEAWRREQAWRIRRLDGLL